MAESIGNSGKGMKLHTKILLGLLIGAVFAATHWPRINSVETGRTPEYPDLAVRDYGASEAKVDKAARGAIAALPRWKT